MTRQHCLDLLVLFFILEFISLTPISAGETVQDDSDMSIVFDPGNPGQQDYIRVIDPPPVLQHARITIEYKCTKVRYVGVEVITDLPGTSAVKVFRKTWRCRVQAGPEGKRTKVRLRLPDSLEYNVNVLNPEGEFGMRTKVRVWILDTNVWPLCRQQDNCFTRSMAKGSYDSEIPPPFLRHFKSFPKSCHSWALSVLIRITSEAIPKCPVEPEIMELVQYPAVMFGLPYGIYRHLPSYSNHQLEWERVQNINNPRLTVSMWLYILDYCSPGRLCSIVYHTTTDGVYLSPVIFLNSNGKLHIQGRLADNTDNAGLTQFSLPKHQWCHLVVTFTKRQWEAVLRHGENWNETYTGDYIFPSRLSLDDTEGHFTFGGEDNTPSFHGYIGQATFYRRQIIDPFQIPHPSSQHPMFRLELSRREEKCRTYLSWISHVEWICDVIKDRQRKKETCVHPGYTMFRGDSYREDPNTCPVSLRTRYKHRKLASNIVKKAVMSGKGLDLTQVGDQIYMYASDMMDQGLAHIKTAVPLLKQSSCYGNTDAMFKLAVILNNGLVVRQDDIQAHAYFMQAALDRHRLSALALGHRHRYGLDGAIEDWEQSFMYYKYVADTTEADRELHIDTDVMTESVLLTDDATVDGQMDEGGDLYTWLTHQAKQGVTGAQNEIARALFWGSQGLKRNMAAAAEYFKMSAETSEDSQSLYDYGLVMVRGQGVEKNVEEGLKHIRKSAEQENPHALGALGWYAMVHEKNYTTAAHYLERAYSYGDPAAAFNLGILHQFGDYPDTPANKDKALYYFTFAASHNSIAGGTMLAYYNMKGTELSPRNVYAAVEWSRFIAEKNPLLGLVLRQGIKAFRRGDTDVALLYYMMAADTGVIAGTFNMAWLCEQNKNGVTSRVAKECVWRQYNLTVQREIQFIDSYALIKMGDYFWYGCEGRKDTRKAAKYYAEAANKQDPQALFNLGFMIEEGETIHTSVLDAIRVPREVQQLPTSLLDHLYTRCKESDHTEAFIPCSIALMRLHVLQFWTGYGFWIKIIWYAGVVSLTFASVYIYLRRNRQHRRPDVVTAL